MSASRRNLLIIALAAGWLGYSAAVLGWAAWNNPPATLCIAR